MRGRRGDPGDHGHRPRSVHAAPHQPDLGHIGKDPRQARRRIEPADGLRSFGRDGDVHFATPSGTERLEDASLRMSRCPAAGGSLAAAGGSRGGTMIDHGHPPQLRPWVIHGCGNLRLSARSGSPIAGHGRPKARQREGVAHVDARPSADSRPMERPRDDLQRPGLLRRPRVLVHVLPPQRFVAGFSEVARRKPHRPVMRLPLGTR